MNNIHYCAQKGGVGTMLGLFLGLHFSCGADSLLPCNSAVKLRVHGSSMGVVKNRNTGMNKNTLFSSKGQQVDLPFFPQPHQDFG